MKATLQLLMSALLLLGLSRVQAADAIPPIPRVLPPEGLEIPADMRSRLEGRLAATKKRLESIRDGSLKPDVEVFTKAVELALVHREFYVEKDFAKADWALDEANKRIDSLERNESPWTKTDGLVVRGYRSSIDSSAQPYGLVIPKNRDDTKPCPLYVWLHGRGDKNTDIHFLQERATRAGQITPPGAIVVHPFGRHCVGWKHAGEIDVLEVVASVRSRYQIDPDRIVLIGFSMGGAGAWHIGAHYANHWVAVSPGAGFVDTARYQKLTPDRYPEWYVQKLWGLYDVPDYVRNLFNTKVIAYSGELDPQRQAAVFMEEAFKGEGRTLEHLIGPGVEHKYEPKTLELLLGRLESIVSAGQNKSPDVVHLQTRTLRYDRQYWVAIQGMEEHWREARVDARRSPDKIEAHTSNATILLFTQLEKLKTPQFVLDGQEILLRERDILTGPSGDKGAFFTKRDGKWGHLSLDAMKDRLPALVKRPQLQGPIDDAFLCSRLLVVEPTGKSQNPRAQAWVESELAHFRDRWRAVMRGELPVKKDIDVTDADLEVAGSVVLWGDPDSNRLMSRLLEKSPVRFAGGKWSLGGVSFDGDRFAPALIYPRSSARLYDYVVINSGLTFREGHDRTNSQQNPKLPDWAIVDITQPPDANSPGRIHDADFFDEQWQLKRQPKAP